MSWRSLLTRHRVFAPIALTIGCVASANHAALTAVDASRSPDTTAYADSAKTDLPSVTGSRRQTNSDTLWTIESGTFAGQQIPLDITRAIGRKGQKDRFWRFAGGTGSSGSVVGWKSNRFPIAVAFRRNRRSPEITSDDSAAFWTILEEMNGDFGMRIFRPATLAGDDPTDVIVVDLGIMREADGLSRVTWAPTGELFDVRVTLRDAGVLHSTRVVTHEMMHALGFGHTTAWRSVVSPDRASSDRLTPEDVAYAELAMRSRIERERVDTRRLIALAVAREQKHSDSEPYAPCGIDASMQRESVGVQLPAGTLTVVPECDER
jgi:hypothetical protein